MPKYELSPAIATQLAKMGYRGTTSDELEDHLPTSIWVTITSKNLVRKEAFFISTRKGEDYMISLNVDDKGEVFLLHKVNAKSRIDALGKMLIFLENSKLLEPNI